MKNFVLLLFLIILFACSGSRRLSNQNLAYRYSPGLNFVFPDYRVYNISKDTSRVFFSVKSSELLFMNVDTSIGFKSSFSISYKLYLGFDSKLELDTGSRFFESIKESDEEFVVSDFFDIKAPDSANYLLQVTFSDLNRQQAVTNFYKIDRTGIQVPENFMIFDEEWNQPIVQNYTDRQVSIRIHHNDTGKRKVFMRYFKNVYPLSSPPFSSNELKPLSYKADITKVVDLENRETVFIDKPGIYHFQFDTLVREGFTFFYFEEDFPRLTNAESLIESIRYLTTRQEFDKIMSSSNRKQAVDDFWLKMAGNRERARILIKSYYSRVQSANIHYTSYVEGWKTDRGLIYIIFGPPTSVYRNQDNESWNYSQNSYYGSLSFTFDKVANPFTDNDFKLRRSHYYEIPWYRAVDSWRDGRVVNDSY